MIRRIVPCLDVKNGRVVKGKKFVDITDVDDPESLAEYYSQSGADEMYFYDISASTEDRRISKEFIDKVAQKTTIPFGIGGGISTLEDIEDIFNRGASKVSINSAAVKNPEFIKLASEKFGSQKIVLAMDVKKVGDNKWNVFLNAGTLDSGVDAIEWAIKTEKLGAGEMVINSIDADGTKEGYDIDLLKAIKKNVNVPIIASGGAGKMEDFLEAIVEADVEGVLAASVFHYKEINIGELKQYLKDNGVEVSL
ncbi:imidazole glycerol phosphate synthase subunit HisF [Tissierella creatinini]|nr:imidazole glycerol phosphate synthase subunit HisF [Tissierella creatinini]TJX66743.1 imidazole glycerol phosphate synthase subunit HisF [Soehngenia saccharolytica]